MEIIDLLVTAECRRRRKRRLLAIATLKEVTCVCCVYILVG